MSVAPHSASEPAPHTDETAAAQGFAADASDPIALRRAIDMALDYRGDVTITRKSSPQPIEGYIFDRKVDRGPPPGELVVRVIPKDSEQRVTIAFSDIARIAFTGKDTASGKSFETWVKKYLQKKTAGEKASIESEPLD